MKKKKSKCCKKFRKKAKLCSSCPLRACLAKAERKQLIAKHHPKNKAA